MADSGGGDPHRPIAVIGGAGFIGSHLVDALLAEGRSVDVLDTLETGSIANLAAARRSGGSLKFHHVDAASADGVAVLALRRPRVVFHLALLVPGEDDAAAASDSFASIVAVCSAARHAGVDKVVVAVPATDIYGRPSARELPVREVPLAANGLRGAAAKAIVDVVTYHREADGLEFTVLALATVYGPRQRPRGGVVAAFVAAALDGEPATMHGEGRQTRDLLYVEDAVDALVKSADRGGGLVVNVGTGTQTSIRDLHKLVTPDGPAAEPGPGRWGEPGRFAVSPVRARIHLAWSPWTSLVDGIGDTVDAARAARASSAEHNGGEAG
ncbi:MAG: NAD-dependent epimerase/dehydratase family protein [Acidimicrobiia bacterium]|nr:NAD-dependent epimerase/dehydratase family protein [Acidimicrobiia bacterium]